MKQGHFFHPQTGNFFRTRLFLYFLLPILLLGCIYVGTRYAWRELRWRYIVIHHTAADFGDLDYYRRLHEQRYGDIAYHIVINNGSNNTAMGQLEYSSRWHARESGASTKNFLANMFGIAIVLVGNFERNSLHQIQEEALIRLLSQLVQEYDIPLDRIIGHREIQNTKCPGKFIDMQTIREKTRKALADN